MRLRTILSILMVSMLCFSRGIGGANAQNITWTPQKQINGAGSSIGPCLATFQNKLFAAWKGVKDDQTIYWSSFDGNSWAPQQQIGGVGTSVGPSLAEFRGRLFAAWRGITGDDGIYWSSFDGRGWAPQKKIDGVGTSFRPSLATWQNRLFAAWKGVNDDQGIYWSSFDGNSWLAQKQIGGVGTAIGPSLASSTSNPGAGAVYASWRGVKGDDSIYFSAFSGGAWQPQRRIGPGGGSSIGPSLGFLYAGDAPYAAWKGTPGDDGIYYGQINKYPPQHQIGGVGTLIGPSLAGFGGRLYAAWRGTEGDDGLWYSSAK